jgi:hypothetical protein
MVPCFIYPANNIEPGNLTYNTNTYFDNLNITITNNILLCTYRIRQARLLFALLEADRPRHGPLFAGCPMGPKGPINFY